MTALLMPWMRVSCAGMMPLGVPGDVPVYVIELPGHGRASDQPLPSTITACASYVLDVLDRLELHRVALGGYSLGGALVAPGVTTHEIDDSRPSPSSPSSSSSAARSEG